jgi:hypothetical protein
MDPFKMPFFMYEILGCFCLSFFFFKKGTLPNKLMIPFFGILFCVEYYCAYLAKRQMPNNHIYNFWFPVEYAFYGFVIEDYITNSSRKKISRILIMLYILLTIVYYSVSQNLRLFSSLIYLFGFVVLLIIMLFKLYEILNQEIINNPIKNEIFWFIMGLLMVNLGGFFHFGAINYLNANNTVIHRALQDLNVYLTMFQYLCFYLYFICKWRTQKLHT